MKRIFRRKNKDLSEVDNKYTYFQTLEVLLTKACNLKCSHCLRGDAKNEEISLETLDNIFSNIDRIQSLGLGGGEISLKPELVEHVYNALKKNNVIVESMNFTTNGIVVSDELLSSLNKIKNYIQSCRDDFQIATYTMPPINVCFSIDDYHLNEMNKLGIDLKDIVRNMVKYKKVLGENSLVLRSESDISVIKIGRATNLQDTKSVPYIEKDIVYPICIGKKAVYLGGIVCISTDGKVVPPNAPFNLEDELAYGNLTSQPLSEILENMNTKQVSIISLNSEYRKMVKSMSNSKKDIKKYLKSYGGQKRRYFINEINEIEME